MIRYLAMDIGCLHCEDGINLSRVIGLCDTKTEAELMCSIERYKSMPHDANGWAHHEFRVFEIDDGR